MIASRKGSRDSRPVARTTAAPPSEPSFITVTLVVRIVDGPTMKKCSPKSAAWTIAPPDMRARPTGRPPHGS